MARMRIDRLTALAFVLIVLCSIGKTEGQTQKRRLYPKASNRKWGDEVNGCRMAIEVDKKEFDPCTPIKVTVYITNTGKTVLPVIFVDLYTQNSFTVKNDKGETVPLTRLGEMLTRETVIFGRSGSNLESGEETYYSFVLNMVHDMTAEGSYSVTLKRKIWKRGDDGKPIKTDGKHEEIEVTSNTIEVKVK